MQKPWKGIDLFVANINYQPDKILRVVAALMQIRQVRKQSCRHRLVINYFLIPPSMAALQ
ncbi:MAG: hypothetical protein AAFO69_04235 [Bacteroidota bacterium]